MEPGKVPCWAVTVTGNKNGHCACCGHESISIWGWVSSELDVVAAYFVRWTSHASDHGAMFHLIMGDWSEKSDAKERYLVSLEFRIVEGRPSFMIRDATDFHSEFTGVASQPFGRSDILNTPLQMQIFSIIDAIYVMPQLEELRLWSD